LPKNPIVEVSNQNTIDHLKEIIYDKKKGTNIMQDWQLYARIKQIDSLPTPIFQIIL